MAKVLDGIRVIDLTRWTAGPSCCMTLSAMGAEVIRVERPGGEEDRLLGPFTFYGDSLSYMIWARNKKGVTLNLRSDKGKEMFKELVKKSDVLVEAFVPGTMERMGLGYDTLKQLNPGLVMSSLCGFGQTGPYKQRVGIDRIVMAMTGLMSFTGFPGNPPTITANAYGDVAAGVYLCLGTMFALFHRQRTGQGQHVDVALMDVDSVFLETVFAEYKTLGEVRKQVGNRRIFNAPNDCFKARDRWVYIGVMTDSIWKRFCKAIAREDLVDDPRFQTNPTRARNWELLNAITQEWVADKTAEEVVKIMEEASVMAGEVATIPEAYNNPQLRAREMIVEV
ncbi:MAG: CoA transferase, partial [Chloroflexota bacterium]